jgi:hypothetical protein
MEAWKISQVLYCWPFSAWLGRQSARAFGTAMVNLLIGFGLIHKARNGPKISRRDYRAAAKITRGGL